MFRGEGQRIGAGDEGNGSVQRDQYPRFHLERVRSGGPVIDSARKVDHGAESDRVAVGINFLGAIERHASAAADGQRIGAAAPNWHLRLQLDVECIHQHDRVLPTAEQTAGVADQVGAVGDELAVRERMTGLQLDGEGVHDNDAVLRPRHEVARG